MAKRSTVFVKTPPRQIVEISEYCVECDGKAKAGFKDIIDAVEYATNLVLAENARRLLLRRQ